MVVYWALFSIPLLWGLLPKTVDLLRYVGVLLLAVFYIIVIGLRDKVGCDWDAYLEHFWLIAPLPLYNAISHFDPAHGLVNWLAARLDLNIYAINLFYSVLFTFGLLRFVSRQPLPWLALACAVPYLISVVAMGYTRQGVALGFIMLAYLAFADRKTWHFAFYVLAGATFHKTALVFIPFVMLINGFKLKFSSLSILLALIVIGGSALTRSIDTYSQNYIQSAVMQSSGGLVRSLVTLTATMAFLMFWRRYKELYRDFDFLVYCTIISFIVAPFVLIASTVSDRLGLYLLPYQIAVASRIPDVFEHSKYRTLTIIAVVGAYAALFYTWLNFSPMAQLCWVPYRNYLGIQEY